MTSANERSQQRCNLKYDEYNNISLKIRLILL
jgi:hypothetical protein